MNIPVDMSRDEIRNVINLIEGTPQVIVKILYGSGLRISEAIRLRVQDIDYI
jgi:integrase